MLVVSSLLLPALPPEHKGCTRLDCAPSCYAPEHRLLGRPWEQGITERELRGRMLRRTVPRGTAWRDVADSLTRQPSLKQPPRPSVEDYREKTAIDGKITW